MAKKNQRNPVNAGLALACVAYGGVLGYALGQSVAEKAAARARESQRINREISDLRQQLYALQHPEEYKEWLENAAKHGHGVGITFGGLL